MTRAGSPKLRRGVRQQEMRHKIQISLLIPEGWATVSVAAIVTAGWLHIEPPRNLVGVLMMSTLFVAPIGALCAMIGAVMLIRRWQSDRSARWFLLGHGVMGGFCLLATLFWLNWKGIQLM